MGWQSGAGGAGGGGGGSGTLTSFNSDVGPDVVATLDGIAAAEATAADVDLNSHKLINVATATANGDAVNLAKANALITAALTGGLADIEGLSPGANDFLQFLAGHWANRTPAQVKTALAVAIADVASLQAALDLKAPLASPTLTSPTLTSPTLTGTVTVPDGVAATAAVSRQQLDAVASSNPSEPECKYGTTAALPTVVYANGASGVGATLTAVGLGALSLDGNTPAVADSVLVKNQVAAEQNGIYTVTTVGSAGVAFVLTRRTNFDQAAEIAGGDTVFVQAGTTNGNTTWTLSVSGAVVVGTTGLPWVQTGGPGSVTAGTGISVTGNQVSIGDAELLAIAGLASAADKLPYFTGSGTAALASLSAFIRNLLDDADASTARTTLGLGSLATLSSIVSANITDGTIVAGDIADGAVTSAKILDATIATGDLADGAVTTAKIADGTIVNADIDAAAAIAPTKLATVTVAKGGTGATDVAGAKAALGLSSVFGQFGGLFSFGHSYTVLGGNASAIDTMSTFTRRFAAALDIPSEEVELWGKIGAAAGSPSDGSDTDAPGIGVVLRHHFPNHWYTAARTAYQASRAKPALSLITLGYNELSRDTATLAAASMKHGLRTLISRMRASHLYNDDASVFAYGGGHWSTPAYAFGTAGTSHKTTTNADSFTLTLPTDFLGGVVGICLVANKNLQPTLNGTINNSVTTLVVSTNTSKGTVAGNDLNAGDVILIGTEQILLGATADHLTFTGCTRAHNSTVAASHNSGVAVNMPTTTATVTWSGTATGATGTTSVAGQGSAGQPIQIVKRFALTSADAGKTIIGTLGGLVGNEALQVDSAWVEDTNLPFVIVVGQPHFHGAIYSWIGATATTFEAVYTALCGGSGEFDANVIYADAPATFTPKTQATLNTTLSSGTTTVNLNPTDATNCVIGVGSRLRTINDAAAYEEMLVTAITKTDTTHWSLTVTRNYNGTTAGAVTAGREFNEMRYIRSDDNVHPSDLGHELLDVVILDTLSTTTQTTLQIAGAAGYTMRRRPRMRDTGFYYVCEQINNSARSTFTPVKDTLYCFPFEVTETCLITEIGTEITTLAASSLVRYVVFADGPGRPGYIANDLGSVATTATGVAAITPGIPIPVRPGWYWIGLVFNDTSGAAMPVLRGFAAGNVIPARGYRIPILVEPSNANTSSTSAAPYGISYSGPTNGGAFVDNPSASETFLAAAGAVPVLWVKTAVNIRD